MINDTEIRQETEGGLEIGTEFYHSYKGLKMSGYGTVCEGYKAMEYLGEGLYSCKMISSNAIPGVPNPAYRVTFHIDTIKSLLRDE